MNERADGKSQTARLTPEESKRFVEAVVKPPEPSEELRAAAERYRAQTRPETMDQRETHIRALARLMTKRGAPSDECENYLQHREYGLALTDLAEDVASE